MQGQCLNLSARETFKNPSVTFLLMKSDLSLNQFNYNGVRHIAIEAECFGDLGGELRLLRELLFQEVTQRNACPAEVLRQCESIFLSQTAWGSHKEQSLCCMMTVNF